MVESGAWTGCTVGQVRRELGPLPKDQADITRDDSFPIASYGID